MSWFYACDLFGVAVFAITGALMAGRKSMDLFGVLVIAIVTSLGGGTLRDVILSHYPVSWIRNDLYILVATLAALPQGNLCDCLYCGRVNLHCAAAVQVV